MILNDMDGREDPGRFPSVAILGLAGRFPGARSATEFWRNVSAGRESIGRGDPPMASRPGVGAADFDAAFFGMSPMAATALSPEHRLFLQCAWEAFEHAGYVGERVPGPVAVFAAPGPHATDRPPASRRSPGLAGDAERDRRGDRRGLATLVSGRLNLTGPSLDVQAAGAGSIAAVHLACQSLLSGECDMAIAGGATVHPDEETDCDHYAAESLSRDGRCRPFDAAAAGTVLTSGVACVVLKRLEDAARDGDRILAMIRGSALNHASGRAGDSTPGLDGQIRAVVEALATAGIGPDEVSYVEAHGAGSPRGDAIEILALTRAYRASTARRGFCAVGSVKGNIGHTGEAAGMAGLLKVVLAMQHRQIPPSLHVERPNPDAHFADSPFYVSTALVDWTVPSGHRRIAGLTALGEGGTNAHLVVEEAPDPTPGTRRNRPRLLVLSARTPTALDTLTGAVAERLRQSPDTNLADVAGTLLDGRAAWSHRRIVVARDAADAALALNPIDGRRVFTGTPSSQPPSVVWLFTGGDCDPGTGAALYATEPVYRQAIDEALSTPGPARVAVQYATGCLLESWGVSPTALMGNGVGEYTAACFAGIMNIGQAMALAAFDRAGADEAERYCHAMAFRPPARPLISTATGRWLTSAEATDPAFWACRLGAVRHPGSLATLLALPAPVFVGIGPGPFQLDPADQPSPAAVVVSTVGQPEEPDSDVTALLTTVGRLWVAGLPLDAARLHAGERWQRVELPTYPFEPTPRSIDPDTAPSPHSAPDPRPAQYARQAPVAEIERDLAGMWRDVLELDEVGVRQDFFELGGHSLGAVRLFGRIRHTFDVDLPLATLFEARTIADLAVLLRNRMDAAARGVEAPLDQEGVTGSSPPLRALVAVQPGSADRTPIFVVHGAGGNVLNVSDLARALGPAQPVFGLQASGIDGVSAPAESIEQMAQSYLDEIRVAQPRGPYLLAGYSGGGIVAFEMARRIEAAGDAIGVLALIDTFHPQMPLPRVTMLTRLERLRTERTSYLRDVVDRLRKSRQDARDARRIEGHVTAGEPVPLALRELRSIRSFSRAASRYTPPAWPGQALLFKAEQVDYYYRAGGPTYGWGETIRGGIEIVPIPGNHDSIMVGANAARIARRLRLAIDAVATRDQDRRG